jgi:hypothetical protein
MGAEAILMLLIELFKDVVIPLAPEAVQAIKDWRDGKITAQQADERAGGAFTLMVGRLQNPHAEAANTNAGVDELLAKKFPQD